MKNSIKLKHNKTLEALLRRPVELSIVVSVAFHQDIETGFAEKAKIKPDRKALDNLILWGILAETETHLSLVDKKVVDITLKRSSQAKRELDQKLLREVQEIEVPADELKYYQMAMSFSERFLDNIRFIEGRDHNIVNGKYGKWVDPIRLMMTKDEITIDQLREVWKFLKRHDFWSANVQSTEKLRQKFDTIYSQIKGYGKQGQKGGGSGKQSPKVSEDYLRKVASKIQGNGTGTGQ